MAEAAPEPGASALPAPEPLPGVETAQDGNGASETPGRISFTVYGEAKPAGSKRVFVNPKTGKPIVTDDAGKGGKAWRQEVAGAAEKAMFEAGLRPLAGPIALLLTFYRPRPRSHYGTGKNAEVLKPSAPAYPTTRPDTLKLARAVEDALTSIVYRDDAQIVDGYQHKRFGSPARCEISVVRVVVLPA
jgi:Holliday junction resolvase RusA-like endonuclease